MQALTKINGRYSPTFVTEEPSTKLAPVEVVEEAFEVPPLSRPPLLTKLLPQTQQSCHPLPKVTQCS